MYGKYCSAEHKKKISLALRNRKFSENHKENLSKSAMGRKRPDLSRLSKNPEFIRRRLLACVKRPTKPELELNTILQKYFPNKWEYVGNGKIVVGTKNPDWIHTDGIKKCIELFGAYWHSPKLNPKIIKRYASTYEGTIEHYKKCGWECLIIWDHELKNENEIAYKINQFIIS